MSKADVMPNHSKKILTGLVAALFFAPALAATIDDKSPKYK